jgi:ABC-2 type transport system permease protein
MAVYRRGYQRYQGPITGRWARFLALPRFAWRRLFQQRLVSLLIVVAMIWPLLCGIFIYISNHADLLLGMDKQFQSFVEVKGSFFLVFMHVQALFSVLLASLAGPGLIAPDLANNALPLYFSRPLSRSEYVLARLMTLAGLLSLITWIPGLLLFGIQTGMAGGSWFRGNWNLGAGIIAGFGTWILLVSFVALAASAYAKMKVVAGGLVLGFFFVLSGASAMMNAVFRSSWGSIFSPIWIARRLWYAMFSVDPPAGPGVWASSLAIVAFVIILLLVLERKLRPVEVIS